MKKHILAAAIMATSPLVMADDSREKVLGELEAASVALRIDVKNHINSIQDKYKSLPKGRDGIASSNGHNQTARSIQKRTSEMLSSASTLKRETFSLFESAGNDITFFGSPDNRRIPFVRASVVLRETLCSEFALNLVLENSTTLFTESISLANTVLNECKAINDGQLGSGRHLDTLEAQRQRVVEPQSSQRKKNKLPPDR